MGIIQQVHQAVRAIPASERLAKCVELWPDFALHVEVADGVALGAVTARWTNKEGHAQRLDQPITEDIDEAQAKRLIVTQALLDEGCRREGITPRNVKRDPNL